MMSKTDESLNYIRSVTDANPEIGLILGSGLGQLGDEIENMQAINYGDIPHFARSTAPGHKGRFVIGQLAGKQVICMQGRLHCYEGHSMEDIIYPVRIMKRLGVRSLILTNAAGGINLSFEPGDFMLVTDHINFMGTNPLIGPNDSNLGPRFCDMTYAYDAGLMDKARQAAAEAGCVLKEGVYLACTGPSFETPAEIRAFRTLGADAVGMSTVPEAIAASHCGIKVVAISCITNMAAGILPNPLSEQEVIDIAGQRSGVFRQLILGVIRRI